jgi:hypothetical protein
VEVKRENSGGGKDEKLQTKRYVEDDGGEKEDNS